MIRHNQAHQNARLLISHLHRLRNLSHPRLLNVRNQNRDLRWRSSTKKRENGLPSHLVERLGDWLGDRCLRWSVVFNGLSFAPIWLLVFEKNKQKGTSMFFFDDDAEKKWSSVRALIDLCHVVLKKVGMISHPVSIRWFCFWCSMLHLFFFFFFGKLIGRMNFQYDVGPWSKKTFDPVAGICPLYSSCSILLRGSPVVAF